MVKYNFDLHSVEDLCNKTGKSVLIIILCISLLYHQYVFLPGTTTVLPFKSSLSLHILKV